MAVYVCCLKFINFFSFTETKIECIGFYFLDF